MHILYRVTYLPHLKANTPPYYYDGSKFNYNGKYLGSPSSSQTDWYTDGMSISDWWKRETKISPENFSIDIVKEYDIITPSNLVIEEKLWHTENNVKLSNLFFNKSIATEGYVSVPRTESTKEKVRIITQTYWNDMTPEKEARKEQLREYNRANSSRKMKELWKNPPEELLNRRPRKGRKLMGDGILYNSAKDAAIALDITREAISYRTKSKHTKDKWYYLDEKSDV